MVLILYMYITIITVLYSYATEAVTCGVPIVTELHATLDKTTGSQFACGFDNIDCNAPSWSCVVLTRLELW